MYQHCHESFYSAKMIAGALRHDQNENVCFCFCRNENLPTVFKKIECSFGKATQFSFFQMFSNCSVTVLIKMISVSSYKIMKSMSRSAISNQITGTHEDAGNNAKHRLKHRKGIQKV